MRQFPAGLAFVGAATALLLGGPAAATNTASNTATNTATNTAAHTRSPVPAGFAGPALPVRYGACTARMLTGEVPPPGAGAGQRYSTLVVTNVSGRSCVLEGYSGLWLLDKFGRALPTTVVTVQPGPVRLILPPGGQAAANMHWGVVPGTGEPVDRQCEPDPATLRVTPPGRRTAFDVPWMYGPVCQHGRIELSAYHLP